ncbi:MAG TPA: flagellin [Thermoguttaceae bacterium]|nr:flagellin [Thermoguttaceae bacterium]
MRIGSSLSGVDLTTQHNLLRAFNQLNQSSVRLATMNRINSGSDDPAGLIAAENLRAELTAIEEASANAARARGVVRTADAAMSEVSSLLNTIRGNVVSAASSGYSDAELQAMQIETDAALDAIDRIGDITSFGGNHLLDGSGTTFVFSPDAGDTVSLALPNINTSALGGAAGRLSDLAGGGSASLTSGNLAEAMSILDSAGGQVLEARVRAGAFEKYTIDSSQRVLDSMAENISSAFSQIQDTDVAAETSRSMRSEILVQAATSAVMQAGRSRSLLGGLFGF